MSIYKPFFLIVLLLPSVTVASGNLYRYTDQNGEQMISSTLPGDAADRGYEVISPRGNVIETVKPRLSENQIAEIEAQKQQAEKEKQAKLLAEQEKEKQARKDALLLKMFSSAQDIERSRDDKVQSIEVQMTITIENLVRLEKQLSDAYKTQKALQARNQVIPKMLKDTIVDTKKQIEDNVDFLKKKEIEKEQIKAQYQDMLTRFNKVKGSLEPSVE